ncbi:ribonuclease H2 complex protein [Malassezia pachydermatis]|uniref:Rnh202 triple barrel domain-containing protein n=1 Tax=Malassezia pachydermatis TaxID=77020 RepID=A0A0M9VMY9_9BASI|nr:hypothetical protein Malapachy_2872 [Malassezia pachydermatis]KOS12532.1 hypothetical protein Malapachy_2872 [Malassezia pachydermatis]
MEATESAAPSTSSRPPWALVYPAQLGLASTRIWVLPHPRSGAPAYFALSDQDSTMYELLSTRPDKAVSRSWFLAPSSSAHTPTDADHGYIVEDGAWRIFSPIDPAFVLLGILASTNDERRMRPLDDWAEAATEFHVRRRAQAMAAQQNNEERHTSWPDLPLFVALPSMHTHLERLCTTQAEPNTTDGHVYRLDWSKMQAWLNTKVERLCTQATEALEPHIARSLPAFPRDEDIAQARRAVARAWVDAYLPPAVEERWHATFT